MTPKITPDARTNRLLATLPAAEWQRWLPRLEPVELALGQVLYEPGRGSPYAYFPTTAVVSLVYNTEDGACDEVAVVGREGIVGIASYMGGGRSTPATAAVQHAGSGIRLPARWIKEEFERSAAVMRVLLSYSLALTVQIAQTALCNRHHTLDHRLARRLLQGLDRQQDREFATTQEQLAGLLGVRRESITVEAQKLQQAGVVRYSRGHIFVLDRLALERRACACYEVLKREFDRLVPREAAVIPAPRSTLIAAVLPKQTGASATCHRGVPVRHLSRSGVPAAPQDGAVVRARQEALTATASGDACDL